MFKESLICIILVVLIYQIYVQYFNKNKKVKNFEEQIPEKDPIKPVENVKPMVYETPNSFIHPQLGKPDKIIEEGYLYTFQNPKPWNAIIFNPNKKESYLFVLRMNGNPESLKTYISKIRDWFQVIPDIKFNYESGELVIPSHDEDIALGLANLIISNLKGDLTLKHIMENNLIQISISKIKSHSSVRIKITEQILENINEYGKTSKGNNQVNYQEDLADTIDSPVKPDLTQTESPKQKQNDEIAAYEGGEYSFLN